MNSVCVCVLPSVPVWGQQLQQSISLLQEDGAWQLSCDQGMKLLTGVVIDDAALSRPQVPPATLSQPGAGRLEKKNKMRLTKSDLELKDKSKCDHDVCKSLAWNVLLLKQRFAPREMVLRAGDVKNVVKTKTSQIDF